MWLLKIIKNIMLVYLITFHSIMSKHFRSKLRTTITIKTSVNNFLRLFIVDYEDFKL